MRHSWIFLAVCFSIKAYSANCKLPQKEKIVIGCTYHCDFFYRYRLKTSATELGLKVEVKDLRGSLDLEKILSEVDGVLIPGGADINPELYLPFATEELQAHTKKNRDLVNLTEEGKERDTLEYNLLTEYQKEDRYKDLPLLGICRGMQMMAVNQKIPLYLDIQSELGIPNRYQKFDQIKVSSTNIEGLFFKDEFWAYKYHHQAIRPDYAKNNPLVEILASSHDGKIAEAFHFKHRPAVGVQFHPERSFPKIKHSIFKWLIEKSCENKSKKLGLIL